MWRKEDVIRKLKDDQGKESLRDYAVRIGCTASLLSEVYNDLREPSPKLIEHLGLVRETIYREKRWR